MTQEERESLEILLDGVFDKYRDTVTAAIDLLRDPMTRSSLQNMRDAQQLILCAMKERDENIANAINVVLGWEMDDRISRICCNLVRGYFSWASHDIQTVIEGIERAEAEKEKEDQDTIREDA